MRLVLAVCLMIVTAGCITVDKYPDVCDVKQTDQDGKAYTKGTFPCKLTRHAVTPPAQP